MYTHPPNNHFGILIWLTGIRMTWASSFAWGLITLPDSTSQNFFLLGQVLNTDGMHDLMIVNAWWDIRLWMYRVVRCPPSACLSLFLFSLTIVETCSDFNYIRQDEECIAVGPLAESVPAGVCNSDDQAVVTLSVLMHSLPVCKPGERRLRGPDTRLGPLFIVGCYGGGVEYSTQL